VDGSLWELEVFRRSMASPVHGHTVAGDARSTVRHFTNNYFPSPPLPINRLVLLAAHAVLMASKENCMGVDGLEVAVIRTGERPNILSREQEQELKLRSESVHRGIEKLLLEPFD